MTISSCWETLIVVVFYFKTRLQSKRIPVLGSLSVKRMSNLYRFVVCLMWVGAMVDGVFALCAVFLTSGRVEGPQASGLVAPMTLEGASFVCRGLVVVWLHSGSISPLNIS